MSRAFIGHLDLIKGSRILLQLPASASEVIHTAINNREWKVSLVQANDDRPSHYLNKKLRGVYQNNELFA